MMLLPEYVIRIIKCSAICNLPAIDTSSIRRQRVVVMSLKNAIVFIGGDAQAIPLVGDRKPSCWRIIVDETHNASHLFMLFCIAWSHKRTNLS